MTRVFVVRSGKDLGRAVREARMTASLTQEDLAHATGVDRTYVARMEAGLSVLLLDRAVRLLRHLGAEITVTLPEHRDG